jgi:hypothetical protein
VRAAFAAALSAMLAIALTGCSAKPPSPDLKCASRPAQVIAAQSVPQAEYVPCISDVQAPWVLMSTDSDQDRTQVVMQWSSSGNATERALVTLQASCSLGETSVTTAGMPADVGVTRTFLGRTVTTIYSFEGGCVQVDLTGGRQQEVEPLTPDDFTIKFVPREVLNQYVLEQTNDRVGLDPGERS